MAIRALIVDDSSVMRKIAERTLRQAGIDLSEVFQTGNGAEALGVLKDSKVDFRTFDPAETSRFSIIAAISDITASAGVVVRSTSVLQSRRSLPIHCRRVPLS